jgi:hypothetical protein
MLCTERGRHYGRGSLATSSSWSSWLSEHPLTTSTSSAAHREVLYTIISDLFRVDLRSLSEQVLRGCCLPSRRAAAFVKHLRRLVERSTLHLHGFVRNMYLYEASATAVPYRSQTAAFMTTHAASKSCVASAYRNKVVPAPVPAKIAQSLGISSCTSGSFITTHNVMFMSTL